jgi:hypothetical protein
MLQVDNQANPNPTNQSMKKKMDPPNPLMKGHVENWQGHPPFLHSSRFPVLNIMW